MEEIRLKKLRATKVVDYGDSFLVQVLQKIVKKNPEISFTCYYYCSYKVLLCQSNKKINK